MQRISISMRLRRVREALTSKKLKILSMPLRTLGVRYYEKARAVTIIVSLPVIIRSVYNFQDTNDLNNVEFSLKNIHSIFMASVFKNSSLFIDIFKRRNKYQVSLSIMRILT